MRKAFGMIELLIVVIVIGCICYACFHPKYGRANPFADSQKVKTQQELVNNKLKDIEDAKALRKKIEQNLDKRY